MLVVHPGAELYGADRALLQTVEALLAVYDVTVAVPVAGPLVAELERAGARVEVSRMPVLRRAAMRPAGAVRLVSDALLGVIPAVRLLRSRASGGVVVNTVTLPSWPLLARLARRRTVVHVHEAEASAGALARWVMSLGPRGAHHVIVNSEFTRAVLQRTLPRRAAAATLVYNSVPGPSRVVPPRSSIEEPVRLVYVGRLSPRKGVRVVLDVVDELRRRGVRAQLALVGGVFPGYEWFETELLDSVRERGLAEHVRFVGFVDDVWPHLADADVVLVPSIAEESFGNTVVEAVLAARPVLVSDSSGLREAAAGHENARLLPVGDVDLWATAVTDVVGRWPAVRQVAVGDAGRASVRYGLDRYREAVVDVVRGLERPGT